MTMQDGEIKLGDIKKVIDPERYIQLVSTFLEWEKKYFHLVEVQEAIL